MEEFKLLSASFSKAQYDNVIYHPFQSWDYGEALKDLGYSVLRFGEYKNQRLKRAFQISLHKIPLTNDLLAHLPRGVFPTSTYISQLRNILSQYRVVHLRIEPYLEKDLKIIIPSDLVRAPDSLTYNYTIQINLVKSETELLNSLQSKTRYNLRLAEKKQVQIKVMNNNQGLKIFGKLLYETAQRKGFFVRPYYYHQKVFARTKDKITNLLIAFHNNTPLSAYELMFFAGRAHFVFGGTSLKYRQFMGSNLLMWRALMLAKARGCQIFDMSETLGPKGDVNHPWYGLTRFASGFGGKYLQFLSNYDLIVNKRKYPFYKNLIGNIMKSLNYTD